MVTVNGKTRLLGIFGDPVAHTLSPAMQNAALFAAEINAVYLPFHVRPEQLKSAVESIRTLNLVGVNVTVPHKVTIIPFLDQIDDDAALIGAVNTVVNHDGILTGFNTDAPGFLESLRHDLSFEPQGKKAVLLGAGGACRAALTALAGDGMVEILIANRTKEKAEMLAEEMFLHFPATRFLACGLVESDLADFLSHTDLLVNTSSVGLAGESFPPFLLKRMQKYAAVYDMVYTKEPTSLIKSAERHGLNSADGRGMLIAQGEAAFLKWFGVAPLKGVMSSEVI